ncbi:SrmB Superfamily II DNA and RNA helicase [Pyrenophora tritici-repentis]|uniref:RNA helicase n=2 Tax=Pyrenophora tritici-repentis TaxID=45151 RepID=A0A2W1G5N2_9PLEO|nr:ATP-dependent RNA helicase DBP3 [Pyrenophora tritici-repentis Pt-1C-BFP]KAF7455519.1 ATP-dependent RNA helicase DBP3 [Pyrenophora tritici-repentis]EDU44623.1 ATP-dependent RNA helicase DBP3 [Pyrenophora tritici-repentis Pt-1C-BFP]KAF7578723.1 SrmB, Superfamily II DNA and RNA helicase [Pyrenophora tritici-repentis]KAI0586394.1 ATP-dependent RNA helicase DBP3 [Pyrenophora tritici-repentis]KAI0588377.1 ATP-dependent RNA helicase DBP3 [Pyrenophora tritici-repentis]
MGKRPISDVVTEDGATTTPELSRKKSKKDKSKKLSKTETNGHAQVEETNGKSVDESADEEKQAKAERKAAKKAAKAAKEALKTAAAADTEDEEAVKAAKKAARKAEKKRAKALAKGEEVTEPTPSSKPTPVAAIVEPATSSATVAEPGHYEESKELTQLPQADVDAFLAKNTMTIQDPQPAARKLRPILNFKYLPVDDAQRAFFAKFSAPTPIQAATWPFLLSGRDMVGVAETGSGKTLAFGVPCVRYISALPQEKRKGIKAVIVSPTRELAVQIYDQLVALATPAGLSVVCVYGGVPKDPQVAACRKAHIVVATPGRLNDLIGEGSADLSKAEYVVLDEADRMLDKGFEEAIRQIISQTPKKRQTLMFTATWPPSVRDLASTFMNSPVKITIGDNQSGELRANVRIKQVVEVVDPRAKEQRLLQLLKQYQSGKNKDDRILVFCLYKKEAVRIENFIRMKGFRVGGIHGDLSQEKRSASLAAFKEGHVPLLVATDVAARGLDIPAVKVVINVTFPLTAEDYVHRIGRTGRAGKEGLAITLFTDHDKALSGSLINVLKAANQPVPEELMKFGTTVKKKEHGAYGAFYKDTENTKAATKITFD